MLPDADFGWSEHLFGSSSEISELYEEEFGVPGVSVGQWVEFRVAVLYVG